MFEQLQLIATGIHIDEVDNDHAADVAEFQLSRNLDGRLAVGPQHRFPGIGRASEGPRVHINDGQRFRRLDDHVATGWQINPGLQGIADRRIHLEMFKQFARLSVGLDQHIGAIGTQEVRHPFNRGSVIHHHPDQVRTHVVTKDAMDEILIAVQQNRGRC